MESDVSKKWADVDTPMFFPDSALITSSFSWTPVIDSWVLNYLATRKERSG